MKLDEFVRWFEDFGFEVHITPTTIDLYVDGQYMVSGTAEDILQLFNLLNEQSVQYEIHDNHMYINDKKCTSVKDMIIATVDPTNFQYVKQLINEKCIKSVHYFYSILQIEIICNLGSTDIIVFERMGYKLYGYYDGRLRFSKVIE